MKPRNPLRNQKGQFVIEAILLMTLSLGLFMTAAKMFREKKIISQVTEGPWSRVSTMIEAGVWAPYSKTSIQSLPNRTQSRGVTLKEYTN